MVTRARGRFRHITGQTGDGSSGRRVRARLAQGFTITAALEVTVIESIAAELGVGFEVAAEIVRARELAASQSFGVNISAELSRTEYMAASIANGFDIEAHLSHGNTESLEAALSFGVDMAAALIVERELEASPLVGFDMQAALSLGREFGASQAFGFSLTAELALGRLLSASPVVGFDIAATLTRGKDVSASLTQGFGIAATLTQTRSLAAALTYGFGMSATLSHASASASYAYNGTTQTYTTSGLVRTFTSVPIGAAASGRLVIIAIGEQGTDAPPSTIASVTLDGVAMTQIIQQTHSIGGASLWALAKDAGTTGTVVATSNTTASAVDVVSWSGYNLNSTTPTASNSVASTTTPSTTLNISAGGFAVGYVMVRKGTPNPTFTWAGLTERLDANIGTSIDHTAADAAFASAQTGLTISATPSSSPLAVGALVVASFR